MVLDILVDVSELTILTDHEWLTVKVRIGFVVNYYGDEHYLFCAHACSIEPQDIRMRQVCPEDVTTVRRE